MDARTFINIHLRDDITISVEGTEGSHWFRIGDSIAVHVYNENALAELLQACDVMAKALIAPME